MLPNSSAQRSYRSDNEPAYRCAAALGRQACPLRHACGVPPLPKGEALAYRKAQKAPLEVATPRGFFLFGVTILTLDIPDFSIPDSPQKSSAVQKVYSHSSLGISCIFLSKFMVYLFCGLARPFYSGGR